jgi:hypothetical protein
MRDESLALDGDALQLLSEGSPGGGEAPQDKKGHGCSDRPALSPDFQAPGDPANGQGWPGGSGGKSCGKEVGDDSFPRGPRSTPETYHSGSSSAGGDRNGKEAISPTCPGADSRSCNRMSYPEGIENVARESGARDNLIGALARDEGDVSHLRLLPTEERSERGSNHRSKPSAALDERLGPSIGVKTGRGRSCKLPLPGGEDPAPPTRLSNLSVGFLGEPYTDSLDPQNSICGGPARDRGESTQGCRTSFPLPPVEGSHGGVSDRKAELHAGKLEGYEGMVYQCQEAEAEFARIHRMLGLTGAALVCRVTIEMGGKPLVACIDTGATFSLLADKVYEELQNALPPLQPTQVELSGAGGESLNVKGAIDAK